jgi:hypothetical protein
MIKLRFDVNLSSTLELLLVECIQLMKANVHKIEKGDLESKEMDR